MDPLSLLEPAATRVRDPLTGRSVWLAGMVQEPRLDGDTLRFTLVCKKDHSPEDRARIKDALVRNLVERGWSGEVVATLRVEGVAPAPKEPVKGMSGPGMQPHGGPIQLQKPDGVKHIVAVSSAKGGVGKSTIACNLAVGLAKLGYKVGLMDADVYGPSLPIMMHVNGRPVGGSHNKVLPLVAHGVNCMSIGFLVDEKEPIIWRGPMVMGVVNQFFKDVDWGETDYLVVDLPPGTGDAQLTMIQGVPIAGAVIVSTPQPVALADAVRGIEMFKKLDVPILGVVENMAWYELPGGGRAHPFGEGGGARLATEYGVPLLAQVPLREGIRAGGDQGRPAVLDGDEVLLSVAKRVAKVLPT